MVWAKPQQYPFPAPVKRLIRQQESASLNCFSLASFSIRGWKSWLIFVASFLPMWGTKYRIENRTHTHTHTHTHTYTTGERRKGNFVTLKYFIVETFGQTLFLWEWVVRIAHVGEFKVFYHTRGRPISFIPCPPVRYASLTLVEYWT